jgi:hypothetical protein
MKTDAGLPKSGSSGPKRSKRERHSRHKGIGLAARAQKIERQLASAAWEAYGEMFGFRDNHARPFTLDLKVLIEPGQTWQMGAEPSVEEQIRNAVCDMATQADVFCSGRVYCHRCDSTECPHSVPPRPSSVFGGYTSTGLPIWPELTQVLLDLRHPKVDQLYQSSGGDLLAAYMEAEVLKGRQLNVFGRQSKTYDVLGQVVFGFLRLTPPGVEAHEQERVAFTLQAVESRNLNGSPRLELNILGEFWDGTPAIDSLTSPYQLRILKAISGARQRIQNMAPRPGVNPERRSTRLRSDVPTRVTRILKELARVLERIVRKTERRTAHAEERRVSNRPTSKAWEDSATASDENILWDNHRHTVVVVGPRNRVHVFSLEGRHVTSLTIEGEAIKSRLRRRRWRLLIGDPLERFSAAVGRNGEGPAPALNQEAEETQTSEPSN